MANPEVCPWCGAEMKHKKPRITQYECLSTADKNGSWQSDKCKDRQIAQLKAMVEKMEAVAETIKKIDPMIQGILKAWADSPIKEPIVDQWMIDLTVVRLFIGAALAGIKEKTRCVATSSSLYFRLSSRQSGS